MELSGSVAVVTGANRGLGRHLAAQLLERGAAKVYGSFASFSDPDGNGWVLQEIKQRLPGR